MSGKRGWMRLINVGQLAAFAVVLAVTVSPSYIVFAHPAQPITPRELGSSWNTDPFVLVALEVTTFIYLLGVEKLWQRAGVGRGITIRQCASFLGAILALLIALVSPLDALSGALFSAHMLQHLILILIAAPLFVLSNLPVALLWALPRHWAQVSGRHWNRAAWLQRGWCILRKPMITWVLFAVILWVWHAPAFYEAALRDDMIHAVEHLGFLVTAMLFWWIIVDTSRPAFLRYGLAIPYLFTTAVQSGILGALMTFTDQPWYPLYANTAASWGLTPMQDQQIAGLIMWIPSGAVFTFLAILCFGAWLGALEQRSAHLLSNAHRNEAGHV